MEDLDILSIHSKIRKDFCKKKSKLKDLHLQVDEIKSFKKSCTKPHLLTMYDDALKELTNKIKDLETNKSRDFYISRSSLLLNEYETLINTPLKKSFNGKLSREDINRNSEILAKKYDIVKEYLELARDTALITIPIMKTENKPEESLSCNVCDNKSWFTITDEHIYTCQSCFSQQTFLRNTPSWGDINRANGGQKYVYDRRVHFRDSMLQYQGKQNCTIPEKIYSDLEVHFELHGALLGSPSDPKEFRYKNVTKRLLREFLGELNYNKQYENIHLIHYKLTGQKPDDISHLEDKLMEEFDQLTMIYDRDFKHLERKSIVSTQCCLYLLLKKHGHPCHQSDFNILKTPERRSDHDDILRHCFGELGWKYASIY